MAGGVLKGFGGVFLAIGLLLFVVGAAAAIYGLVDEQDNREHAGPAGVGYDRDRSDVDQQLIVGGGVAAGIGFVLTILGAVLLASGSGRANRALVKAVAARGPQADPTVAGTSSALAATAPAASAARPAASVTPAPQGQRRALGAGVAALILVGLGLAILLLVVGPANLGTLVGAEPDGPTPILQTELAGRVSSGPTVLGTSTLAGDGTQPDAFTLSEPARIEYRIDWTPETTACCKTLNVHLQLNVGGTWGDLQEATVTPGQTLNVTADGMGEYRFEVYPGEDGVSAGQDYTITLVAWSLKA